MTNEQITLYTKAFLGAGLLLSMLTIIGISCAMIWSVFFGNKPQNFNEHMVYALTNILGILFAKWIYTWLINYVNTNIQIGLLAIFIAYCVASAATIIRLFT